MSKQPAKIVGSVAAAGTVVTEQAQQELQDKAVVQEPAEEAKKAQEPAAVAPVAEQAVQEPAAAQDVQAGEVKEPAQQEAPQQVSEGVQAPVAGAVVAPKPEAVAQATVRAGAKVVVGAGSVVKAAPAAAAVSGTLQEKLEKILQNVPAAFAVDITRIQQYCVTMAPGKPVGEKIGAAEQAALYRSIQNIINRQETHFTELFTAMLAIFVAERHGALGDRYRNRFMETVNLSKADRAAFQNITHLLSVLAPVTNREQAMKQVNIEASLASGLTMQGQRRVLQFFGV